MSDTGPKRIFVYGTLRRDVASPKDYEHGEVVGHGRIGGRMYRASGWFPGVVPSDDNEVVGQLISYEDLDDDEWHRLIQSMDRYEGAPTLYRRETVTVRMEDGRTVESQVYFYNRPVEDLNEIPSGDWAEIAGERH